MSFVGAIFGKVKNHQIGKNLSSTVLPRVFHKYFGSFQYSTTINYCIDTYRVWISLDFRALLIPFIIL